MGSLVSRTWLVLWTTVLIFVGGCSEPIEEPAEVLEFHVDEASMQNFYDRRGAINAHNERGIPPAAALTAGADKSHPVGVIIWDPEQTGRSMGFKNGDKVIAMGGETTESIYSKKWQGFGEFKEPSAFGTDKYTGFLYDVFARRYQGGSVLLVLYRKQGRHWEPQSIGIRIAFEEE